MYDDATAVDEASGDLHCILERVLITYTYVHLHAQCTLRVHGGGGEKKEGLLKGKSDE